MYFCRKDFFSIQNHCAKFESNKHNKINKEKTEQTEIETQKKTKQNKRKKKTTPKTETARRKHFLREDHNKHLSIIQNITIHFLLFDKTQITTNNKGSTREEHIF